MAKWSFCVWRSSLSAWMVALWLGEVTAGDSAGRSQLSPQAPLLHRAPAFSKPESCRSPPKALSLFVPGCGPSCLCAVMVPCAMNNSSVLRGPERQGGACVWPGLRESMVSPPLHLPGGHLLWDERLRLSLPTALWQDPWGMAAVATGLYLDALASHAVTGCHP